MTRKLRNRNEVKCEPVEGLPVTPLTGLMRTCLVNRHIIRAQGDMTMCEHCGHLWRLTEQKEFEYVGRIEIDLPPPPPPDRPFMLNGGDDNIGIWPTVFTCLIVVCVSIIIVTLAFYANK